MAEFRDTAPLSIQKRAKATRITVSGIYKTFSSDKWVRNTASPQTQVSGISGDTGRHFVNSGSVANSLDYDSTLLFMIIKLQIILRTFHGELSFNNDGDSGVKIRIKPLKETILLPCMPAFIIFI